MHGACQPACRQYGLRSVLAGLLCQAPCSCCHPTLAIMLLCRTSASSCQLRSTARARPGPSQTLRVSRACPTAELLGVAASCWLWTCIQRSQANLAAQRCCLRPMQEGPGSRKGWDPGRAGIQGGLATTARCEDEIRLHHARGCEESVWGPTTLLCSAALGTGTAALAAIWWWRHCLTGISTPSVCHLTYTQVCGSAGLASICWRVACS